jgi:carbon-monoxide dehydrogenase iron sulfur subunit
VEKKMKRIVINEDVCMGCGLCRVYCQTEHSKSKNIIKAWKKESPQPLPRVRVERKGDLFFSLQCRNCDEPWCAYSCLTGALQKDPETGNITFDSNKCMGCWTCILACPNGAIARDINRKVVAKCDLCPDLETPACVANCPNEALSLVDDGKPAAVSVI